MSGAWERAGARLIIDLGAIRRNYRTLTARLAPGTRLAAVVKADAYGLGAGPVLTALAAEGCREFFVATLDEGRAARRIAPRAAVYVLNGALGGSEREFARHGLIPMLNDLDAIVRWAALARADGVARTAAVHIDTGMARLGLEPSAAARLAREPQWLEGLGLRLIMSHLVAAEETENPLNAAQLQAIQNLREQWKEPAFSLANSSGIFLGSKFHFDMVRPGAALYGINPVPGAPNPMAPAVRLEARIVAMREVAPPATVGYGASWRARRNSRIATVPIGYADGYPRRLGNRSRAVVVDGPAKGAVMPLAGRVSMDLITLDATALPENVCRPGMAVELIGPDCPVDDLAAMSDTIGYELLTGLGRRVPRHYVGEAAS